MSRVLYLSRWKLFASGAGTTLLITLSSIILGTVIGFAVFMFCRKGNRIANGITDAALWLIQGMPTVLLLMILYYIIFGSTRLSGTIVAIVGFTLIFACSMYDMLAVGFGAIGNGQYEAATALGYSDRQSFFKILLPQAARHFLPIYKNEVVTLIKETSVAGYIAIQDLTKISDLVRARTYQAFFALIFTAIIYFVISGALTRIVGIERSSSGHVHRLFGRYNLVECDMPYTAKFMSVHSYCLFLVSCSQSSLLCRKCSKKGLILTRVQPLSLSPCYASL